MKKDILEAKNEMLLRELVKTKRELREREIQLIRALDGFRLDVAEAILELQESLTIKKQA